MSKLHEKVAIVTGGAASIGYAITKGLSDAGAKVVVAARSQESGEAIESQLKNVTFIQTDITSDEQLQKLVNQTISKYGRLDILVNNACSYGDDGAATSRSTWLETLNVSAVSAAVLGEIARPHIACTKGCIINIGSVSGVFPHVQRWAYPVAKAALRHISKSQALDYAQYGIRVNLLRLGHIWSSPFEGLTQNDRAHADKVTAPFNLMGRVANGDEVAKAAVFIASGDASYITGSELVLDGGYSAMGPEQHYPLMPLLMDKE